MSDEVDTAEPTPPSKKKKRKGLWLKAVVGLLLVGGGSGGAYAYFLRGSIAGHGEGGEDKDIPQLVLKGEEDPYAPPASAGEAEESGEIPGEGGSKYRTAYFLFDGDFTSNLKNSAGLIQCSLAVSTHRDGRVLMWLKQHELALRSRILVELADTPEEEVLTPEGKERLQQRLAKAINEVLTEAEGFGGVEDVYFRSLLVQ